MKTRFFKLTRAPKLIALAVALTVAVPVAAQAGSSFYNWHSKADGMVYTMTNAAAGNAIQAFARSADGKLTPQRTFYTGGKGTGANLGTQGAIAISDSGHWLLAVNAGSNSVSAFLVLGNYLLRTDTEYSGGISPVSVTIKNDVVYVLNGGSDSIRGFKLDLYGRLSPIANSERALSGAATGAVQVQFNRDGDLLAVTEKVANKVLTWAVDGDGLLGPVTTLDSPTPTPFGFAFGRRDQMLVSEAAGGAAGASTLSSYQVGGDGGNTLITKSVASHQSAACWVTVTRDGEYAWTSNTSSDNMSTYKISEYGEVTLGAAVAAATGSKPVDSALDRNDKYLYTLNSGSGTISAFAVGEGGSLTPIQTGSASQLTAAATGLVAR